MMMMMIDIPFGMEKLEWLGYHAEGEKISKIPLFILALLTNVTDRQTDRHRMPAIAVLMHSIARQKLRCKYVEDKQEASRGFSETRASCLTSSSAVAKRPRDASCLSVVSFNSTKRRVESFCRAMLCKRGRCLSVRLSRS